MWLMGDSITQEFMVAMECLFFEWHEHPRWLDGSGWGGLPFGRHRVSNNTEALEIITKEGQVRAGPSNFVCVVTGMVHLLRRQ